MNEFSTVDINGNICCFQYSQEVVELSDDEVLFKVYSIPKDEIRWFSYKAKILNENLAKSEHLSINGNVEFAKKGIPEAIIQIASSELNRNIQSSPITYHERNYLTPASKKAWERLVNQNTNANLDIANDCFIYNR